MRNVRSFTKTSVLLVSMILIVSVITSTDISGMYVVAQGNSSSNMTSPSVNTTTRTSALDLNKTMAALESSNNPQDIATLAYIWGYPLVSVVRLVDYSSSPNVPPGPGRGPINTFSNFRSFPHPILPILLVLM